MGFAPGVFPVSFLILCDFLYGFLIIICLLRADWARVSLEKTVQHILLGGTLVLALIWQIKADLYPGLEVHLLGLTVIALAVGWELAVLTGFFASVVKVLFFGLALEVMAVEALVVTALPVLVTYLFLWWERWMGFRLFFAYMFICGFFAAAFSAGAAASVSAFILWLFDVYPLPFLGEHYLQYLPLIMLPEGFVNGIVMAGLIVYFPERLITFDQTRYL